MNKLLKNLTLALFLIVNGLIVPACGSTQGTETEPTEITKAAHTPVKVDSEAP